MSYPIQLFGFMIVMGSVVPPTAASNVTASESDEGPLLLGRARQHFSVGECLHSDGFDTPDAWHVQIEPIDTETTSRITFHHGILDLYMPERGCTAWLKQRFSGPIAIVYEVRCPIETLQDPGIQARDLNNFWHATDPLSEKGLFDPLRYTGRFTTYHKLHGYYASTGGGGRIGNRTIRFRRYPRNTPDGNPASHIALTTRDGESELLIVPGRWHRIQLVVSGGFVQYGFDGKLVYEIAPGDEVTVEHPDGSVSRQRYTLDRFPAYESGYFGFRMVGSHHQYRRLRIYRLLPFPTAAP